MFRFDRFEALRTSKGITKKFVSDAIGRSSQTIQDWKNGKTEPNDVQIAIVSELLGTSPEYLRGEVDLHGLTDNDWRTMGAVYQGERTMRGKSLESAADGPVLTVDDLRDFEDNGTPLTLNQLEVACGGIGMSAPSVFQPWADKLYGTKKEPVVSDELAESLEILRERPETRTLLHASKRMTATQVRQIAEFMMSLRGDEDGQVD